jgi:hypothetical protein
MRDVSPGNPVAASVNKKEATIITAIQIASRVL